MTLGGVKFDWKLTLAVVLTTLVSMVDFYGHQITAVKAYDRFIFYFLIPLAVIVLLYRERPADFGFQIGKWREGLAWVLVACTLMVFVLLVVARLPAMRAYYASRTPDVVSTVLWRNAVEMFAWEFVWRGFLLFTLARVIGPGPAIMLQAVPFAFMHLRKPEIETYSTIIGGAAFGLIAWRTKSFLYPWAIHWFILSFTALSAIGRLPF